MYPNGSPENVGTSVANGVLFVVKGVGKLATAPLNLAKGVASGVSNLGMLAMLGMGALATGSGMVAASSATASSTAGAFITGFAAKFGALWSATEIAIPGTSIAFGVGGGLAIGPALGLATILAIGVIWGLNILTGFIDKMTGNSPSPAFA